MHSCVHRNGRIHLKTENGKLNTFQKSFCAPLLQMFLYVFLALELITVIIIDIDRALGADQHRTRENSFCCSSY